uniref:Uncharacterized protein n=1 Tax=Ditylenchus dipsaci TaxID=166011 RepID=A0A915E8T6_9BILA
MNKATLTGNNFFEESKPIGTVFSENKGQMVRKFQMFWQSNDHKREAKITTAHNHLGDLTRDHLKKMQGEVQAEAISSKKPPRSIIAAKIRSLPETAKPFVLKSLLGRNIRNLRHEANLEPSNPKTLHDLKLLEANKKWGCDKTFDVVPSLFDQLWIVFVRLTHSYVQSSFVDFFLYLAVSKRTEQNSEAGNMGKK